MDLSQIDQSAWPSPCRDMVPHLVWILKDDDQEWSVESPDRLIHATTGLVFRIVSMNSIELHYRNELVGHLREGDRTISHVHSRFRSLLTTGLDDAMVAIKLCSGYVPQASSGAAAARTPSPPTLSPSAANILNAIRTRSSVGSSGLGSLAGKI